jgi:hypothetical protein
MFEFTILRPDHYPQQKRRWNIRWGNGPRVSLSAALCRFNCKPRRERSIKRTKWGRMPSRAFLNDHGALVADTPVLQSIRGAAVRLLLTTMH